MNNDVESLIRDGLINEDQVYAGLLSEDRIKILFPEENFRPLSAHQKLDSTLKMIEQRSNEKNYIWLTKVDFGPFT